MRYRAARAGCAGLVVLAACSDAGMSPDPTGDASRAAARFEQLADSVEGAGYSPAAEALRHAAEIVRLTGRATPVTVTIDGTARSFLAVGEQLDFPNLQCSWPGDSGSVQPGDSVMPGDTMLTTGGALAGDTAIGPGPGPDPVPGECTVVDTSSMRTLIAWEPDRMDQVVRIVSDLGGTVVEPTVPDVMAGLPTPRPDTAPDGGGTGGGTGGGQTFPGFMGEYLVRDVGSWYAVEGTQSNALLELSGSCTSPRTTFDWAEFDCEAARLRFAFDMRVEPLRYVPLMGTPAAAGPEGSHTLGLSSSDVDGVRLTIRAWTPPPLPPPGEPPPPGPVGPPIPVDSIVRPSP